MFIKHVVVNLKENHLKYTIFTLASLTFSINVFSAEDFKDCGVTEIRMGSDDRNAHIKLDCLISTELACATAKNYVAFDRSTESGNQKLSVFLAAFAAGSKITGAVKNSCPSWQSNVAELEWLILGR